MPPADAEDTEGSVETSTAAESTSTATEPSTEAEPSTTEEEAKELVDLVKMQMHGTVLSSDSSDDTSLICKSINFLEGDFVRFVQYFSSASTITRIVIARENSNGFVDVPYWGENTGSFKSGITSYPKDQFYGFATQSIEEDVMTMASLAFIKVSKVCLDTFKIEEAQRL